MDILIRNALIYGEYMNRLSNERKQALLEKIICRRRERADELPDEANHPP